MCVGRVSNVASNEQACDVSRLKAASPAEERGDARTGDRIGTECRVVF